MRMQRTILLGIYFLGSCFVVVAENRTFLWFSDIHLDPYYGTEMAMSHNKFNASLNCNSIATSFPLGDYGCDSPPALVELVLEHAASNAGNKVDFCIITGDLVRHQNDVLLSPMNDTQAILHTVSDQIVQHFPEIPIIPSLGNNDVTPDYYFDIQHPQEMLDMVTGGLQDLLGDDDAVDFFRKGGYYSRSISPQLSILSLNTILYSTSHQPVQKFERDPLGQLKWLWEQLQWAEATNSSVYIMGHIPPTVGSYRHTQMWKQEYLELYYQIVGRYSSHVKGQLFGHIHTEEFRVHGEFPLFLTASFTPIYGSNPSYRVVTYDSETSDLLDYRVHYLDLTTNSNSGDQQQQQQQQQQQPQWLLGDKFTQAYGVPDMSVTSLRQIVQDLQQSTDSRHWEALLNRQHAFSHGSEVCNAKCRKEWACTLSSMTTAQYNHCLGRGAQDIALIVGLVLGGVGLAVVLRKLFQRYSKRGTYRKTALEEIEDVWDGAMGEEEVPPVQ